jgi:uncharacterized protein (DUF1697 family)
MRYVAFIRNVNLGQPRSPTRAQLENAFLQAGASTATSFLSNGTLIYSVSGNRLAQNIAHRAGKILQQVCALKEPIFVCSFQHLVELVAEDPFSDFKGSTNVGYAMSFFDPKIGTKVMLPIESKRKDCLIFRIDAGEAFSIVREVNGKEGYPTPVLESVLNSPVTTRNWTTILRMLRKHG